MCIKGTDYGQSESDYYGVLKEVIQLEYVGVPLKYIVLFNCEWFDPTINRGMRVHKQFGFVELRPTRRYNKYEPFILAQQAMQVYYAPYPTSRDKADWMCVIRTKARSTIDAPTSKEDNGAYQEDESNIIVACAVDNTELPNLHDREAIFEEVDVPAIDDAIVDDLESDEDLETDDDNVEEDEEILGDDDTEDDISLSDSIEDE